MSWPSRAYPLSIALILAVGLLTGSGDAAAVADGGQAPRLGAGEPPDSLFVETARQTPPSSMSSQTIRRRSIRVRPGAIVSGAIVSAEAHVLNLFPDVAIVAMRSHVEIRDAGRYSWFGTTPGDPLGRVIITVFDDTLGAVIMSRGRRYAVLPRGGAHEVLELADSGVDDDEEFEARIVGRGPVQLEPTGGGRLPRAARAVPLDRRGLFRLVPFHFAEVNGDLDPTFKRLQDDGSAIDLMFVYTHQAAHSADPSEVAPVHSPPHTSIGLFLKIQQAIDLANLSYAESGVPTRLQWIGMPLEVTYTESGDFFTDLHAIADGAGVLERRELFAADIVVILTATGTAGANGLTMHQRTLDDDDDFDTEAAAAANAFVIVKEAQLPDYTLAHEVGHQLGAVHDGSSLTNVARYARGYVHPHATMGFRTIMGRPTTCAGLPCPRLGRWSDPNALHPVHGVPLGSPEFSTSPAFAKRAISENLRAVANYRLSLCRLMMGC